MKLSDNIDNILKSKPSRININDGLPVSYQSANSFFHFMKKEKFLHEIIIDKRIYPRFCKEDISSLDLDLKNISIAMKCFCNIPLHMVNNHKKEYGFFCIGLSKEWGIRKGLQPVIYFNDKSSFPNSLKTSYEAAMKYSFDDQLLVEMSDIMNFIFKYVKPVIGTDLKTKKKKDFTDEKEWRYVPEINDLQFGEIIVEQNIIENGNLIESYNKVIKKEGYYLEFDYDDIKYLFVKNDAQRRKLIKVINQLKCSEDEKNKLITKICVWEEMEGDF